MSQDGASHTSPAVKRLPSLKPPRDLTLTQSTGNTVAQPTLAAGANKPKFAPNLALAGKRNAPEPNLSAAKPENVKKTAFEKRARNQRAEPVFVQAHGVFSEGFAEGAGPSKAGAVHIPCASSAATGTSKWSSAGAGRGSKSAKDGDSELSSTVTSESTATDEAALSELLKDSFIGDLKQEACEPQVVPVNNRIKKEEYFGGTVNKKRHGAPADDDDSNDSQSSSVFVDQGSAGKFIFVQLPSVLTEMLAANGDTLKKEIKSEPVSSPTGNTNKSALSFDQKINAKENKHVLTNAPHGWCGKLQILKSGKMRLKLGVENDEQKHVYFDVSTSKTCFAQQVVHIRCDEEGGGMLNVLSNKVKHRLLITPNIEYIASSLAR